MINAPFLILLVGAGVAMLLPDRLRRPALLAFPVLGLGNLIMMDQSVSWTVDLFGIDLILFDADRLNFLFGILFHIAAIIGIVFAWHVKDRPQQAASLLYPGSALGVVFAGDFLTLFVFWECLALTSVFFITARGTEKAIRAAIRYLVVQVVSGVTCPG